MASVVFPDDSGPNISTTLPFGIPPIPSAISKLIDPVGMLGILTIFSSLNYIIVPFPYVFSSFSIARFNAFDFSFDSFISIIFIFLLK